MTHPLTLAKTQRDARRADAPDWRMYDDQTITDGLWHYQNNAYAVDWQCFRAPRAMTGLVNTWIWRAVGFWRPGWVLVGATLHVINALLVYRLLVVVGLGALAPFATAIFLVHPIQVPAVLQPSARATIQSATLAYSALLCLVTGFWPIALLAQFLAVKTKEDAWLYLAFWPIVLFFVAGT